MEHRDLAWHEVTLGEIAEIFDGPHATPKKTDNGPVFLGISNIVKGRIDLSVTQHLSESDYRTWTRRVTPEPGDIVFSYETKLGEAAAVPHGLRCCLGRRMGLLRPRTESVDPRFLLYAYLGQQFQKTILSRVVQGSTVDRILLSELGAFPIELPVDIAEQRAIAHVLGALDDKIELNRRMNETLEEMAQALFKSWFVDFDPVRAKMEGRWRRGESLPGLPADLYDLFPDRMVPSELGEIPEGWEVGVLDNMIELLSGGTPRTSVASFWDGDIPWYTAKDAPSLSDVFVLETERTIAKAGIENSAAKVLAAGITIITARGTVGRLACLGIPMAMNQTCYGIRGVQGYPDYFTYWNVRTAVDELQQRTHGTIFDTITRQTFNWHFPYWKSSCSKGSPNEMIGSYSGPTKHVNRDASMPARIAEVPTDSRPFCAGNAQWYDRPSADGNAAAKRRSLHRHHRLGIPVGEGVHVRQHEVPGAVGAERRLVLPPDDGEGAQDVVRVVVVEAVEVEIERVKAGAQVAALLIVPGERRPVVPQVTGELGRVRQPQHVVADEIARRRVAKPPFVVVGRDDRELLNDVPTDMCTLHFLPHNVIESETVEARLDRIGRLSPAPS